MTIQSRCWLIATATIFAVLLISHFQQAGAGRVSMPIQALGPTGEMWYRPDPQPIWSFAITNTGKHDVNWAAGISVKDGADKGYAYAGGFIDWPEGILAPGQGLHTSMIVPARSGSVWSAGVTCWRANTGGSFKTFSDEWHQTSR